MQKKESEAKSQDKYDGLKMQNVSLFQQSLFRGIYKVHRFKQAKYLTLPPPPPYTPFNKRMTSLKQNDRPPIFLYLHT